MQLLLVSGLSRKFIVAVNLPCAENHETLFASTYVMSLIGINANPDANGSKNYTLSLPSIV
jgi:hypothetical protein